MGVGGVDMFTHTSKASRTSWAIGYLFFLLSGILVFLSPSQVLLAALLKILVYAWASFLTAGGAACLYGKLRGSWVGEIIGLPLLSTSNLIFGVLLLARGTSSATLGIGGIFVGFAIVLWSRWLEVRRLARINQGVNSEL